MHDGKAFDEIDMRVRLIQPETHPRPMDTSLKSRMAPHLGLLTIARIVEEHGHAVEVINENLGRDMPSDEVDLVGISASVDVLPRAKVLADEYARLGVPVAVGGIGVSADPATAEGMFSTICIGPAEGHWPDVLKDAANGRLESVYRTSPDFSGGDLLPPSFASVDTSGFLYSNVIAASRGCPFACDFCYNSAVKGSCGYRHRTVESVMEEIRSKATRHIMFIDDNFIGDTAFTRALLEEMRPLRLKWSAAVSANITEMPDLLDLMRDTGCRSLFVGFESLSAEAIEQVHKGQNRTAKYEELVEALHSRGIMVNASFVFGLDGDDSTVFDSTVKWVVKNRIETVTSHILTPYPGTVFYERMKAEGRITDNDLSHYDTAHVVFSPKGMTERELYDGYLKVYRDIYSFGNILRRMPRTPSQILPYLMFNLFYRKFGRLTERIGGLFSFSGIGRFARRISYWIS